jgi:hypothetical protein
VVCYSNNEFVVGDRLHFKFVVVPCRASLGLFRGLCAITVRSQYLSKASGVGSVFFGGPI